jgi:hypothetical protein
MWTKAAFPRQRLSRVARAPAQRTERLRAAVTAAIAALLAVYISLGLVSRHGRQFDRGVAPLWPFRAYVAESVVTLIVLGACLYHSVKRWRGKYNRSTMLLVVGFMLSLAWVVLVLYAYAS